MKEKIQFCSTPFWYGLILLASTAFPGVSFGQGGLPAIPAQPSTPQFVQPTPQPGDGGQQPQPGGGRQTGETSDGGLVEIDPFSAVEFAEFENTRNQGFVGATSTRLQELGFIGAPSQLFGNPAADANATFGGGVNTTAGTGASGGGGGGGGRSGFGGQGSGLGNFGSTQFGQGTGNQNSFVVQRGPLRAAVNPNFTSPVASDNQVADRFAASFLRLPQSQLFNGQYQVVVRDKRATVSGWVNSQAESDHLVAQLRFQPGVYEVINNLEIREE